MGMTPSELNVQCKIVELVEKHYKNVKLNYCFVSDDYVTLSGEGITTTNSPWIAKRILDNIKSVRIVHFTGGWLEGVYTRNTLSWAGYKMK